MSVPGQVQKAKGLWRGNSLLNLSDFAPKNPITESKSSLHVDTDRQDKFATITYTWSHEGKEHEGTMLVCGNKKTKEVELAWVDSWHQNASVLHLKGTEAADGSVKAKGTYGAGKETWGWTIELKLESDQLLLVMENVTPDGKAEWAVKGTYKRD